MQHLPKSALFCIARPWLPMAVNVTMTGYLYTRHLNIKDLWKMALSYYKMRSGGTFRPKIWKTGISDGMFSEYIILKNRPVIGKLSQTLKFNYYFTSD